MNERYDFVTRHVNLRTQLLCHSVEEILWSIFEEGECFECVSYLRLALWSKTRTSKPRGLLLRGDYHWLGRGERRDKGERRRARWSVVVGRRRR
jgi:hypothetical protein